MDNRYGNKLIKDIKVLKAKLVQRSLQSQRKALQAKELFDDTISEDIHG